LENLIVTNFILRWSITVRVTKISPIKSWVNEKGFGKFFNVDLIDKTGEIRATAFNESCDRYFNLFEIGKVFFRGFLLSNTTPFTYFIYFILYSRTRDA
jgi:hypothetical protein